MREPITTNLRKLEILAADAFKRLERKSYIHSGNYSQYKTGHTPIPYQRHPNDGYDESGLRSGNNILDLFDVEKKDGTIVDKENITLSATLHKQLLKKVGDHKRKEKPWTKSNSVLFKPKIIEIPEIEEVPIAPLIQEN